jgi:hypothetical protein
VGALDVGDVQLVVGGGDGLGQRDPGIVEVDDPPGETEHLASRSLVRSRSSRIWPVRSVGFDEDGIWRPAQVIA